MTVCITDRELRGINLMKPAICAAVHPDCGKIKCLLSLPYAITETIPVNYCGKLTEIFLHGVSMQRPHQNRQQEARNWRPGQALRSSTTANANRHHRSLPRHRQRTSENNSRLSSRNPRRWWCYGRVGAHRRTTRVREQGARALRGVCAIDAWAKYVKR